MNKKFILICYFNFVLFSSCLNNTTKSSEWIILNSKRTCDSVGLKNTIACFEEGNGFSLIFYSSNDHHSIKKLYFLPGYPPFIDSLIYIQPNVYSSPKLYTSYHIKDSTVLCIQEVPIFHPNSTLKGQSPWKQAYVNSRKRLYN